LGRNCLLEPDIEGKIEGGLEAKGKGGRRHKQLLDDSKEKRGYWKLKEEALDRIVWRIRFARGYGPVVIQATKRSFLVPNNDSYSYGGNTPLIF
jgi:hypothetical protein